MMNEIPTKTRTGERTEPFLMVGQEKSRLDFRFGQLAKFEAAREDESATRAGKARWKVFGPFRGDGLFACGGTRVSVHRACTAAKRLGIHWPNGVAVPLSAPPISGLLDIQT